MSDHPDKQNWIDLATKELRGKPLESLDWLTPEGIPVNPGKAGVHGRRP
jgi:methylmalonyl-CoA mutase